MEDLSKSFKIDLVYFRNQGDNFYEPANENILIKHIFTTTTLTKLLSAISIPFIFPLFTAKFSLSKLLKLKKFIRSEAYDFLYFDFSQMFLYGKCINHDKTVFMSHDVIGQRYERKHKLIGSWAKISEKWILNNCNNVYTFSQKDSSLLNNWYNISSVPTSFYFEKNVEDAVPDKIGSYFVFFAMWKRPDNYEGLNWFLKNVLPQLNDISFKIIGTGLPENIKTSISTYKNVEYLGFVDNPYPIIANSLALVSPLFQGAGVKVKVLDALAVGTPIIGTEISFEGIDETYSSFMYRADTAYEFIEKLRTINVPLEARQDLKEIFIKKTKSKEIIKYLQSN